MDQTTSQPLIVLNNDTVVCEICYEPPEFEIDPGQVPFGHTTMGVCYTCGAVGPEGAGPTTREPLWERRKLSLLCANPDCGGWIDPPQRGVPYLDSNTKSVVLVCEVCAGQFGSGNSRFQRIDPEKEQAK